MDTFAYCTREHVKRALDQKLTAYTDWQVDRAVESSRAQVESLCGGRRFHPWTGTRYRDWPTHRTSDSWRLWLDDDLISASAIVSGGTTLTASQYLLRRSDDRDEPPYSHIEILLSSTGSWSSASGTHQQSIAITGVWGYTADRVVAGALAEAIDDSETGVDVTNSAVVGVGDIIIVDSERMVVVEKTMADTGVDIDAADSLTASVADVSITVSTTTGMPQVGETILIGSERMLVVDVAGSVVTVKRQWDGTVLATHAGSASIYAPRTLTVQRGQLGTTAATHTTSTAVYRHTPPPLVRDLSIGEAVNIVLQEQSAYARTSGAGDNARDYSARGLNRLRTDVYDAYGRQMRTAAI